MTLFRLVYASTSLLSEKPHLASEQIEQILIVSRRNNEAAEITGALLFSDTNFPRCSKVPAARLSASTKPFIAIHDIRTCSYC